MIYVQCPECKWHGVSTEMIVLPAVPTGDEAYPFACPQLCPVCRHPEPGMITLENHMRLSFSDGMALLDEDEEADTPKIKWREFI